MGKFGSPEVLCGALSIVGESPAWNAQTLQLAMIDVHGQRVRFLDWKLCRAEDVVLDDRPGAAMWLPDGRLAVACGKSILALDSSRRPVPLVSSLPLDGIRFNDVKIGPDGWFWGGTYTMSSTGGAFYRISTTGECVRMFGDVGNSNGIDWDLERRFFYHVDTPKGTVVRYRYDPETFALSDRRVLRTFDKNEGFPDGMVRDSDGLLWIALWGASRVVAIDPDSGVDADEIRLPVSQPTCPAFAGNGRMVITTAAHGLNLREEPLAGATFAAGPR